jgi:hypothetical protein
MKRGAAVALLLAGGLGASSCVAAQSAAPSTAWHGQRFNADADAVASRSDIVLNNRTCNPARPLGNRRLGLAV